MKKKLLTLFIFITFLSFSQTNLAADGGFENWTDTTTLVNWTIENDISQNTTDMIEGVSCASLKIDNNNLSPKVITQVPLESGVLYNVSFKYKYVDSNFNGSHSICLKLVRAGSGTTTTACTSPNDNQWNTRSTTFTPDQTGDYDLSISSSNFFNGETFEILIDEVQIYDPNAAGIDELLEEKFKIYPSVTDDYLYFSNSSNLDYHISIYDFYGRKQKIKLQSNAIDLSALNSGIYLVNIKIGVNTITKKIIKK